MIDCNKTVNFLNEFDRMCNSYAHCDICEIGILNDDYDYNCKKFILKNSEHAIDIVQKWSDVHPRKTLLDDLKEKYPNYQTSYDDVPRVCTYALGYDKEIQCRNFVPTITCKECWNRPLDEVMNK